MTDCRKLTNWQKAQEYNRLLKENARLRDENERLRKALEKICEFDPSNEDVKHLLLMSNPSKHAAVFKIHLIAQQALAAEGGE